MHHHDHPNHPSAFEVYWTKRRMWIAVTWSVMVAALAVSYYFFVFLPQQQRAQLEFAQAQQEMRAKLNQAQLDAQKAQTDAEARAKADQKAQMDACLQNVDHAYTALWDRECADRGLAPDCRLPTAASDSLNQYYKDEKDNCFKQYPQA